MPRVTVNDVTLHYEDVGVGKPIVILHGYVGDGEDWRPQIDLLSANYRCIAIDQRGRGKAEAPRRSAQYSVNIFTDDICRVMKRLELEKVLLMGHSLGGSIACQLVTSHPEMVSALVLADTRSESGPVSPEAQAYFDKLADLAMKEGTVAAFDWDVANNPATQARYRLHPETMAYMREKTRTTSREGYVYVRDAINAWGGVTEKLGAIAVPTLVVCGEDDAPFIEDAKELHRRIRGSDLVWITHAGHGSMYERPEDFNDAVSKFLAKINY
jgi:3-oxoadipate enol-lactonase